MPPTAFANFRTIYRSVCPERGADAEVARCREDLRNRLAAIVILAGGVRIDPLSQVTRRARLGLPISADQTLVSYWVHQARCLALELNLDRLELRLLLSEGHGLPRPTSHDVIHLTHSLDAASFRGTGGVLSDVAADYRADDLLLIVGGAQLLRQPLYSIGIELARCPSSIALAVRGDSTPCDIALATAGALHSIRAPGYVDFKEQSLLELSREGSVGVARCSGPLTLPVRTFSQYLHALQAQHAARGADGDPLAERFDRPQFSIIEPGARVGKNVRVIDSVVLAGACIGDNAVVARCLVGPGASIRRGACVIDQLIG